MGLRSGFAFSFALCDGLSFLALPVIVFISVMAAKLWRGKDEKLVYDQPRKAGRNVQGSSPSKVRIPPGMCVMPHKPLLRH